MKRKTECSVTVTLFQLDHKDEKVEKTPTNQLSIGQKSTTKLKLNQAKSETDLKTMM